MVHIRDEGSYFDGSIQTVWRYLNSDDEHPKAHRSVRKRQANRWGTPRSS